MCFAHSYDSVDRILLGLLKENFTNFMRVGSVKKMAKPILDYTASRAEGNNQTQCTFALYEIDKETLRDLKDMLKDNTLSAAERQSTLKFIKDMEHDNAKEREERLKSSPVVGA
jgi:hypothetical protein